VWWRRPGGRCRCRGRSARSAGVRTMKRTSTEQPAGTDQSEEMDSRGLTSQGHCAALSSPSLA